MSDPVVRSLRGISRFPGNYSRTIVGLAILLLAVAPASGTVSVAVDARANIFGAGHSIAPDPGGAGGGFLPPGIRLAPGQTELVVNAATGTVSCCGTGGPNGPDGNGWASGTTDILSWGGISGIIHDGRTMFLTGVFIDDSEPVDPAPERLDFSPGATGDGFLTLSPRLQQVFFIGDGLTGTGSGERQTFIIPAGATRLYVGFADALEFGFPTSYPGWYWDNVGSLQVDLRIEGEVILDGVPWVGYQTDCMPWVPLEGSYFDGGNWLGFVPPTTAQYGLFGTGIGEHPFSPNVLHFGNYCETANGCSDSYINGGAARSRGLYFQTGIWTLDLSSFFEGGCPPGDPITGSYTAEEQILIGGPRSGWDSGAHVTARNGTVDSHLLVLGATEDSRGELELRGGAVWNATDVRVGTVGDGVLTVAGSSVLHVTQDLACFDIGTSGPGVGLVTVTGAGSRLDHLDALNVGTGTLSLENGGTAGARTCKGGGEPGDRARIRIRGDGSELAAETLELGAAGLAEFEMAHDAHARFLSATVGGSGTGVIELKQGSVVSVTNTLAVGSGGEVNTSPSTVVEAGSCELAEGGRLLGEGVLVGNLSNAGEVSPGSPTGVLAIQGDYAQSPEGRLTLEIGRSPKGHPGTGFDVLDVTGHVELNGTVSISLRPGFRPPEGAEWTILRAGSISGSFAAVGLAGFTASLRYEPTRCVLVMGTMKALPGSEQALARDPSAEVSFSLELVGGNVLSSTRDLTVGFSVPSPGGHVRIALYDAAGRICGGVIDRDVAGGRYEDHIENSQDRIHAGVYFLRMESGRYQKIQRVVLVH